MNADDVDYIGYSGSVISFNIIAYCENNPIDGMDSYGHSNDKKAYYIYVYYYDKNSVSPMGHVDISNDEKNIRSYGTYNGVGGGAALKKYEYNSSNGGYFGKYSKVAKIKASYDEYVRYITYINMCFLLYTSGEPYKNGDKLFIQEYRVIRGPYADYDMYQRNCSTFVVDVLSVVFPKKIKMVSIIKPISMIPYVTYLIARGLSILK